MYAIITFYIVDLHKRNELGVTQGTHKSSCLKRVNNKIALSFLFNQTEKHELGSC